MHTVGIATNPRKWRRPAPCPACRKSQPLILTLGTIYNLRTRKPVNTIYGCICPNCRHKCILHVDGKNLKKAIRLWNHHASACGQVRRLAVLRRGRRIHGMRHHPDRHEASGLHRLLDERQAGRPVLRLGSRERRGQGTTVKIWSQCGAVCIAPEDDEERQACEIVSRPVGSAGTDLAWTRVSHHRRQIFIDKGTIK